MVPPWKSVNETIGNYQLTHDRRIRTAAYTVHVILIGMLFLHLVLMCSIDADPESCTLIFVQTKRTCDKLDDILYDKV